MITDNRLELYSKGLSDAEIAKAIGTTKNIISRWRYYKGLPNKNPRKTKSYTGGTIKLTKRTGVPMEQALNPEQCEVMREFLAKLVTAADQCQGSKNINNFIAVYRKLYAGELALNA